MRDRDADAIVANGQCFPADTLSDTVDSDLLEIRHHCVPIWGSAMPVAAHTSDWPNLHAAEVRKLATLLEISQALLAAREFQPGLVKVLDILGAHHGAIRSSVVLLNERTGEVAVKASAGAADGSKAVRYQLGEGVAGEVIQSGKPMIVPQVSREPRFANRAAVRSDLADRELTCICVPIAIDGATLGALRIDRSTTRTATTNGLRNPRRRRADDRAGDEGSPAD